MKKLFKDDFHLLTAIQEGNRNAIYQIHKEMFPFLCSFSEKMINDTMQAQDIANESIRKTLERRANFESLGQLKKHMIVITKNESLNYIKHVRAIKNLYSRVLPPSEPSEETTHLYLIYSDVVKAIYEEIAKFSDQDQLIARYFLFSDLSTEQIAEILKMNPKTLLNRKGALVNIIRKALNKKGLPLFMLLCICWN